MSESLEKNLQISNIEGKISREKLQESVSVLEKCLSDFAIIVEGVRDAREFDLAGRLFLKLYEKTHPNFIVRKVTAHSLKNALVPLGLMLRQKKFSKTEKKGLASDLDELQQKELCQFYDKVSREEFLDKLNDLDNPYWDEKGLRFYALAHGFSGVMNQLLEQKYHHTEVDARAVADISGEELADTILEDAFMQQEKVPQFKEALDKRYKWKKQRGK